MNDSAVAGGEDEPAAVSFDHVGERLYWEAAERIHEWILRQGILIRAESDAAEVTTDALRVARLREVILDFGRGLLALAAKHESTEKGFDIISHWC